MRKLSIIGFVVAFLAAVPTLAHDGAVATSRDGQSMVDPNSAVTIGGPFTMTDSNGRAVTDKDFLGKYMLLFFGFTSCPDVCPTEMQNITNALDILGPAGADIVPVLVTVDPERDTPEVMAEYTKKFSDRIVGLTGTKEQIAGIAKAYRVYYGRVDAKDVPADHQSGAYAMDHSSFLYLMGREGEFRRVFASNIDASELAEGLRAILNKY
jgi:protein SCO1/2